MAALFDRPLPLPGSVTEIPRSLLSSTVEFAAKVGTGRSIAEIASPSIAGLVQKVIGSMFMTKLKTLTACLLLIGAGAFGLRLATAQSDRGRRTKPADEPTTASVKTKAQPPLRLMTEYVVEPPDLLTVEVLEALPGRPISGERLVRPDGKITLGFYGDVYVAGLTLAEIKEKIVLHLRKFISDENLGLVVDANADETSPAPTRGERTGPLGDTRGADQRVPGDSSPFHLRREDEKPKADVPAQPVRSSLKPRKVEPRDSDRVFVDVTAYNSKVYYVQGEVLTPGRLPVTGQERILDAIGFAGGLSQEADHEQVFLYREGATREPAQTLKIDIDQIMLGDDLSTNYQVLPGDRLVVRRRKGLPPETSIDATKPSTFSANPDAESQRFSPSPDPTPKTQPPTKPMPAYVVEPPDVLLVEVLEALPGRPISGERLVRPDGKISLGFYGEIFVAGMDLSEIKEKIIARLQQHNISDEQLGLLVVDENRENAVDPNTKAIKRIDPKNSNRVFVDVTAYNSKVYYVQGAFRVPGRNLITGKERVLDAINFAGGLTKEANHGQVYLYREGPRGQPVQTLKIDIEQITMGDDLSTNYQIQPGDRLVAGGGAGGPSAGKAQRQQSSAPKSRPFVGVNDQLGRQNPPANLPAKGGTEPPGAGDVYAELRLLEKRIAAMENKLDAILAAIKRPAR
jgi:protein involved in polysaccharide export with SLBB domain